MVNEDRVKQLYKVALYDETEEKEHRQAGQYYRYEYIAKEVIKSIFSGMLAYLLMVVLLLIGNWTEVLRQLDTWEIMDTLVLVLVGFAVFMVVYIAITIVVYRSRYKRSIKKLDTHISDMKVLYKMFAREEKLKS